MADYDDEIERARRRMFAAQTKVVELERVASENARTGPGPHVERHRRNHVLLVVARREYSAAYADYARIEREQMGWPEIPRGKVQCRECGKVGSPKHLGAHTRNHDASREAVDDFDEDSD